MNTPPRPTTQPRPRVAPSAPWAFPAAERAPLANRLEVLLYHLPGQHVVSAGLLLDVPLSAEPRPLEGVAALTVATIDEGTDDHPGRTFAEAVERCGAELTGGVGYSATRLYVDVPSRRLGDALRLLGEAVASPQLADADVERHRTIRLAQVEQQLAQSSERANHAFRRTVLSDASRASRMADGEAGTVPAITGEQVRRHHRELFGPAGASLVLAGDFRGDPWADADAALGGWRPNQVRAEHERPAPRSQHAFLIDRPGSVQADVRYGGFTIDRRDPRWFDLQVGVRAVGGSFLSRLNRVLREEKGFTYGVHLANAPMRAGGYSCVQGSFRNDAVAQAVSLMPSLLDVGAQPITAEEVERARTYLSGVQPLQYATASGVCNGIMGLLSAGLSADYIDSLRAALELVTPEMATETASELMPPDELSLVIVGDASVLAADLARQGISTRVVANGDWI